MSDSRPSEQPSLFQFLDAGEVEIDARFPSLERIQLDSASWVDEAPGWVRGSQTLFDRLSAEVAWGQRARWMYDREVTEPRLTAGWSVDSGVSTLPGELEQMRVVLSARYGVDFDSVGLNLYRDGRDSVAWHGDRIDRSILEPVVALVSLGEPRPFLLRPKGGGSSRRFLLGRGDLLVTGGRTQRDWQHSVPKVASAGPRISIAFRHGTYRPAAARG
jgi:alkylated DNA repair dioxygenase AlkB